MLCGGGGVGRAVTGRIRGVVGSPMYTQRPLSQFHSWKETATCSSSYHPQTQPGRCRPLV